MDLSSQFPSWAWELVLTSLYRWGGAPWGRLWACIHLLGFYSQNRIGLPKLGSWFHGVQSMAPGLTLPSAAGEVWLHPQPLPWEQRHRGQAGWVQPSVTGHYKQRGIFPFIWNPAKGEIQHLSSVIWELDRLISSRNDFEMILLGTRQSGWFFKVFFHPVCSDHLKENGILYPNRYL